ncbi:TLD_family protein [Hexamita inflata]|uniref:TLD family protein n=1 Tax=Hexamita inflata TaxID=28002 RepID=A0AA86PQU7_9EUKA|nr:TLD family protein [Hexamita inflata]
MLVYWCLLSEQQFQLQAYAWIFYLSYFPAVQQLYQLLQISLNLYAPVLTLNLVGKYLIHVVQIIKIIHHTKSDLAISCDMIFEITARHTSHTSIETNSDQSLTCDSSIGSDIQNMLSASQSQKMQKSQFALEALYLGRKSQILNDILSIRLQMFLPKMVSRLSMFVQFTSKFDGKHLHNLYNSFKPHAINFDQDRQKYNMHIDMSRTKFSQTSLILVKAADQVFGFGFTGELKSTTTTFQNLFVFNLSENKQYAAKKEVLVRMFDRLIVGASGSAIVLHKNLQKVYTSASESFQSPELFRGERYEQFVEAEIDCVEVIRFVF